MYFNFFVTHAKKLNNISHFALRLFLKITVYTFIISYFDFFFFFVKDIHLLNYIRMFFCPVKFFVRFSTITQ